MSKGKETQVIKVPDIGDFSDVEIIDVLVSEGDRIAAEDPLITLETDKAAMDVPSPAAGTVLALKVKTGDRVSEGDAVLELEVSSDAGAAGAEDDKPAADDSGKTSADAPADAAPTEETVKVPDIGDFTDVEIIEVLVGEGDEVTAEQGLITLETDKAAMDVPAPKAGTVLSLKVSQGDKVSEGDAILTLRASAGEAAAEDNEDASGPAAPAPAVADTARTTTAAPARSAAQKRELPPIDEAGFAKAHASPSVRKFARELGVDLGRVKGSGHKGRVTGDDVKAFVKSVLSGVAPGGGPALPEVPVVDFTKFGEIDRKPLSRIQKISGPRLQASWINLPHVTQHDLADITDLEQTRKGLKEKAASEGVKLTPLAFFIKAVMQALIEYPQFNASLDPDGEHLILKKYFHIGFAADTPNGLVVPVIRDVDKKGVFEVAAELAELASKAREGKLKGEQMQGGCFTVSSLGGIGGTAFTPIINAPEVAILGISRASMQPVWDGKAFQPRLMLPLSLSYDHRVIDGAAAARFTTFLSDVLREMRDLKP